MTLAQVVLNQMPALPAALSDMSEVLDIFTRVIAALAALSYVPVLLAVLSHMSEASDILSRWLPSVIYHISSWPQ